MVKTFEFTHKTFAEYLIARRVIRCFEQATKKFASNEVDSEEGWDSREALFKWAQVCGSTRMDGYIVSFIRREMAIRGVEDAKSMQGTGSRLLGVAVRTGWPMQRFNELTFAKQVQAAKNSEESMMACLNACARVTGDTSDLAWPSPTAAGAFIKNLQGQRRGPTNEVIMDCLSHLNLSDCCFDMADLYGADLTGSDMRGSALHYTNLGNANLTAADLREARILETTLSMTVISNTKFSKDFPRLIARDRRDRHEGIGRDRESHNSGRDLERDAEEYQKDFERRGAIFS